MVDAKEKHNHKEGDVNPEEEEDLSLTIHGTKNTHVFMGEKAAEISQIKTKISFGDFNYVQST